MFSRSAVSRLVAEDGRKHASASSRCAIGPMRRCRPVATRPCSAPFACVVCDGMDLGSAPDVGGAGSSWQTPARTVFGAGRR